MGSEQFRYIKSKSNPADALTREYALKEIKTTPKQVDKWKENTRDVHATPVSEGREGSSIFPHVLERSSMFEKVRRVLSYVHHFAKRARHRDAANGSLTVQELMQAELQLLKWSQKHINLQSLDR